MWQFNDSCADCDLHKAKGEGRTLICNVYEKSDIYPILPLDNSNHHEFSILLPFGTFSKNLIFHKVLEFFYFFSPTLDDISHEFIAYGESERAYFFAKRYKEDRFHRLGYHLNSMKRNDVSGIIEISKTFSNASDIPLSLCCCEKNENSISIPLDDVDRLTAFLENLAV